MSRRVNALRYFTASLFTFDVQGKDSVIGCVYNGGRVDVEASINLQKPKRNEKLPNVWFTIVNT